VRRADNLTTFMCRLSRNLGASTSWNPVSLSRPVMGLLYLLFRYRYNVTLVILFYTLNNLHDAGISLTRYVTVNLLRTPSLTATDSVFCEHDINFNPGFWEYKWSYTSRSNSLHFLQTFSAGHVSSEGKHFQYREMRAHFFHHGGTKTGR
jgi:hypothetical protein